MTPAEQRAWDEKIHALKHAGVGMPERAELAKRQLAAEAAARAKPETSDPAPRIVPNNDSAAEPAAESGEPDQTVDKAKAKPRADGKAQPGRNRPKQRKPVDRKDAKTMTALPVSTGTDARRDEPPPATNGGLMKPPAAAAFLAIGKRKLWELTNSKRIPCVRIDRAVRYRLSDLEQWIEQHRDGGLAG